MKSMPDMGTEYTWKKHRNQDPYALMYQFCLLPMELVAIIEIKARLRTLHRGGI